MISYSFSHLAKQDQQLSQVVNGTRLAQNLQSNMKQFLELNAQEDNKPGVAIISVGKKQDALLYLKRKKRTCETLGINFHNYEFPEDTSEGHLIEKILELNDAPHIHGTMIQLPLPGHLRQSTQKIVDQIMPEKDVDGLTNENLSRLFLDESLPHHIACTPSACLHILKEFNIDLSGKRCVIVNRSRVVGLPLSSLLMKNGATLVNCSTRTPNLREEISQGDIILTAIGKHNLIKADWIKPGAVVLDIGINVIEDHGEKKVVGDINFPDAVNRAGLITPVPGGVGPLTVMMLMKNVISGWARSCNLDFDSSYCANLSKSI